MAYVPGRYTFGIEEEFFLVRARTGALASQVPKRLVERCRERFGECVTHELLQAQIEIASPVFHDDDEALAELVRLRRGIAEVAGDWNLKPMAAGTHPLSPWYRQLPTGKRRYTQLVDDFQIVGRRSLICGLHIHVAVPDGIDRVELMNRLMPWLPLFLSLSASSPFWNRLDTGLHSYRQSADDEWPRTGIPDFFADEAQYGAFVDLLRRAGALTDASTLWWAIRPALRYSTLELRIADCCTHVEDAVALASLFRCLVRAHVRRPELGAQRSALTRRLIDENRWRAKRHGIAAEFIDEDGGEPVPVRRCLDQLRALTAEDAAALGCEASLRRLDVVFGRGTSADEQLAIYRRRLDAGAGRLGALRAVVDWLLATTVASPAE